MLRRSVWRSPAWTTSAAAAGYLIQVTGGGALLASSRSRNFTLAGRGRDLNGICGILILEFDGLHASESNSRGRRLFVRAASFYLVVLVRHELPGQGGEGGAARRC